MDGGFPQAQACPEYRGTSRPQTPLRRAQPGGRQEESPGPGDPGEAGALVQLPLAMEEAVVWASASGALIPLSNDSALHPHGFPVSPTELSMAP